MLGIHLSQLIYLPIPVIEHYFDTHPNLSAKDVEYLLGCALYHQNKYSTSLYPRISGESY